jgi:hypothetical protein
MSAAGIQFGCQTTRTSLSPLRDLRSANTVSGIIMWLSLSDGACGTGSLTSKTMVCNNVVFLSTTHLLSRARRRCSAAQHPTAAQEAAFHLNNGCPRTQMTSSNAVEQRTVWPAA